MRNLTALLAVLGLVLASAAFTGPARAQPVPAAGFLPEHLPLAHAACFRVDDDATLDFPALVERFPGVPDAATRLEELGWVDGATRRFGCDAPPAGSAALIDVGVHRFGDPASAEAAVAFFADARAQATGLRPATAPELGTRSAALAGPSGGGSDYTLYASQGPLLFRVIGVAPVGTPAADVEQVMATLLRGSDAAELHQERSEENPGPPATRAPEYPTSADPAFVILDLGTGYGNTSMARHVNSRGEVLWAWGTTRDQMSGLYSDPHQMLSWNGMATDLTPLGMDFAVAVNDLGMVLGQSRGRGLLYWPDTGTVEPLAGFEQDAWPADVNDFGVVTGNVAGRAVVADGSRLVDLPPAPGYGFLEPVAVNDAGDVAGTARTSRTDLSAQRAVLVADGTVTVLDPAPGATSSRAADLNEGGQVVGGPDVQGMHAVRQPGRAFLYDRVTGLTTDIGTLPEYENSVATAINNEGQVVGYAWLPDIEGDPIRRAFLYDHRTGAISDLNDLIPEDSGWHLFDAFDISDTGQIVGQGMIDGEMHGFVLTPSR
jgi:probable HAF family extracellular repeat protein